MKKSDKKDFVEVTIPIVFVVNVFDYITQKSFDSKEEFSSYDDAINWIKNYDFDSVFGSNPIGISIHSSPKVTFGSLNI